MYIYIYECSRLAQVFDHFSRAYQWLGGRGLDAVGTASCLIQSFGIVCVVRRAVCLRVCGDRPLGKPCARMSCRLPVGCLLRHMWSQNGRWVMHGPTSMRQYRVVQPDYRSAPLAFGRGFCLRIVTGCGGLCFGGGVAFSPNRGMHPSLATYW